MSISKGKMRLDRPISQIHNWGLDPRYLSNSLCTDAPPPLRKYQGERRLWIAVVNLVPVNTYVNYSVCFPSDSWKGVDRPTPLLLFLFSPCSPVPLVSPVLLVPLFRFVLLIPPFSISPCSPCSRSPLLPCSPHSTCYPVPLVPQFPLFPLPFVPLFPLFPCFSCFPCSPCSPFSAVALVFLFPLFPCVCFLIKPLILLWIVCQKQAQFFYVSCCIVACRSVL